MFRYETHLHTAPASACAKKTVRENLEFYRSIGYDGVFITNHFLDGNFCERKNDALSYEEKLRVYFADYEEGLRIGKEIGIRVFLGEELTYGGTDFLIYGLQKEWFFDHPEIMKMEKSKELPFLMSEGALVIQAHPYREASYIDHIRLFPRCVQGVEVLNACRTELENRMAEQYAAAYGLCRTAGTDNHKGAERPLLAGMEWDTPLRDEADFIARVLAGTGHIFTIDRSEDAKKAAEA